MATTTKSRGSRRKSPTVAITFSKFDTSNPRYRIAREAIPIKEFSAVALEEFRPNGGTPLVDATFTFINHLDKLRKPDAVTVGLLLDESGSMADAFRGAGYQAAVVAGVNRFVDGMRDVKKVDPDAAGNVLAVIVTDGEENSSYEHRTDELMRLVADRESEGYTFIFLGANIDAWHQARSIGFSGTASGQSMNFVATPKGVANAMRSVTTDSASYLASNAAYTTSRSGSSMRSLSEDGKESLTNSGAGTNAASGPGWNVFVNAAGNQANWTATFTSNADAGIDAYRKATDEEEEEK